MKITEKNLNNILNKIHYPLDFIANYIDNLQTYIETKAIYLRIPFLLFVSFPFIILTRIYTIILNVLFLLIYSIKSVLGFYIIYLIIKLSEKYILHNSTLYMSLLIFVGLTLMFFSFIRLKYLDIIHNQNSFERLLKEYWTTPTNGLTFVFLFYLFSFSILLKGLYLYNPMYFIEHGSKPFYYYLLHSIQIPFNAITIDLIPTFFSETKLFAENLPLKIKIIYFTYKSLTSSVLIIWIMELFKLEYERKNCR